MNQPPGIIVRIAQHENLSPAMVARIIMEKYALAEDANGIFIIIIVFISCTCH